MPKLLKPFRLPHRQPSQSSNLLDGIILLQHTTSSFFGTFVCNRLQLLLQRTDLRKTQIISRVAFDSFKQNIVLLRSILFSRKSTCCITLYKSSLFRIFIFWASVRRTFMLKNLLFNIGKINLFAIACGKAKRP